MIEKRKSSVHGYGLFATENIRADTNLGKLKGNWVQPGGIHVLEIGEQSFLVTCDLKYINHGDNPNVCYYDDRTVGTLREIKVDEEILHDYSGEDTVFEGYTRCSHCCKVARVASGRVCYHIAKMWDYKACPNLNQPAKWVESKEIMAGGRDPRGKCMRCGWEFSDGPNTDCPQCCIEAWHAQ